MKSSCSTRATPHALRTEWVRRHLVSIGITTPLSGVAYSQGAAQAQWPTPRGAYPAMPVQTVASAPQSLQAFVLKMRSTDIAGDIQPIIADIIPNPPLGRRFPFSPLEIAAVAGGKLITLDASGSITYRSALPPYARAVSFVADSSLLPLQLRSRMPSVLLLETAEHYAPQDSLAVAYVAGYDPAADSVAIITRLAYDLRPTVPNLAAWVRPVFATTVSNSLVVYAAIGMTSPSRQGRILRGIAVTTINPSLLGGTFPIADAGDRPAERWTVAPHAGIDQPSIASLAQNAWLAAVPCTSSNDSVTVTTPLGSPTLGTRSYLLAPVLTGGTIAEQFPPIELDSILSALGAQPTVIPFIVTLNDGSGDRQYILVAETYSGRQEGVGRAQLHLVASDGTLLTHPSDPQRPPFRARSAHGWSLGVGNVDGITTNTLLPYYPNNPGAELILTESSRTLAVAQSRLIVLRYRSGSPVPKPSPTGAVLFPLDTIVTFPITGWLAAVADLDSSSDGKAEILLADKDNLYVLRMRDYADPRFRTGAPFDTVWSWQTASEEITNVAVADLDGDRRLDVIVTTSRSTSVFGTITPDALTFISPLDTTYCLGDSIHLSWRFRYAGARRYTIGFQPYDSTQARGPLRIIVSDTLLGGNPVQVHIPASALGRTQKRLIVWLCTDSTIRDSSGFLVITPGQLQFDATSLPQQATAGSRLLLGGRSLCVDTVLFYGSLGNNTFWQQLSASSVIGGTTFLARVDIPCIPFPALGGPDTLIRIRAVGISAPDTTYSDTIALRILPPPVALRITQQEPAYCCRYTIALESGTAPCSNAAVYVQYAPTEQWILLDSAFQESVVLHWREGSSDTVRIRWACIGTCYRSDTSIITTSVRILQGIVPNPVLRSQAQCQILTTPPRDNRITIRIFDGSDRLVRTVVQDELRVGRRTYCDIWDCRSDSGELVPPGLYYVLVQSSNGWKSYEAVYVR